MSEGVEWGLHCCLTLAWLEDVRPVPSARLAALMDVSPTYLNKCLQRLTRAGILASATGPRGGLALARAPEDISLLDVVVAMEGRDDLFTCTEIRQQGRGAEGAGPSDFAHPCGIAAAMRRADLAWKRELAAQTLADLIATTPAASAQRVRRGYQRLTASLGG